MAGRRMFKESPRMELSSHKKRILTAVIGLPVVLAAVFLGGWLFFALVLAVCVIGMGEFLSIRQPEPGAQRLAAGTIFSGAVLFGFYWAGPAAALGALILVWWLENLGFLAKFGAGAPDAVPPSGLMTAGLLYLPCAMGFFLTFAPKETLFVLTAVIVSDTGAYYSGSLFGGPKIWPTVSPKKTWAGSLGGLVLTMLWCLAYGSLWGEAAAIAWLAAGAALNVASQLGDFYESALKRSGGVKDSGRILPGHGGVLDRIDGLVLAAPVYAAIRSANAFFG